MSQVEQHSVKFGSIIKLHFEMCRREINGTANPLWIAPHKLPSGTSVFAYQFFMRMQFWPTRAFDLAEGTARKKFHRDHAGEKWLRKNHVEDIAEKASQTPFEEAWYPDWWLSFLLLGLPSGNGVRPCFLSGKASDVDSLAVIRNLSAKTNRRAVDSLLSGAGGKAPRSDEPDRKMQKTMTVKHQHMYADEDMTVMQSREKSIANLKDTLVTLQSLGIPITDESHQEVLLALLKEQQGLRKDLGILLQKKATAYETPV